MTHPRFLLDSRRQTMQHHCSVSLSWITDVLCGLWRSKIHFELSSISFMQISFVSRQWAGTSLQRGTRWRRLCSPGKSLLPEPWLHAPGWRLQRRFDFPRRHHKRLPVVSSFRLLLDSVWWNIGRFILYIIDHQLAALGQIHCTVKSGPRLDSETEDQREKKIFKKTTTET